MIIALKLVSGFLSYCIKVVFFLMVALADLI